MPTPGRHSVNGRCYDPRADQPLADKFTGNNFSGQGSRGEDRASGNSITQMAKPLDSHFLHLLRRLADTDKPA
jgi:hypothetical protein